MSEARKIGWLMEVWTYTEANDYHHGKSNLTPPIINKKDTKGYFATLRSSTLVSFYYFVRHMSSGRSIFRFL